MDVATPQAPVAVVVHNPLKSLVIRPSLGDNSYLEKSFTKNLG